VVANKYLCPVCGFWMEAPASDYNICSCCGTEFGNHDINASITQLRASWLRNGARWWGQFDAVPAGWDPYTQVSALLANGSVWDRVFRIAQPEPNLPGRLLSMISGEKKEQPDVLPPLSRQRHLYASAGLEPSIHQLGQPV
jgi:hypothetical protein